MTPRKLNWRVIEPKLAMIRELLDQLAAQGEFDEARLSYRDLESLGVERILALVVDLAIAINNHVVVAKLGKSPADYKESFRAAAKAGMITDELARTLAPSAGLRNSLVHAYLEIDYRRVAAAIPLSQKYYREYIRQVSRWVREQVGESRD